MYPSQAISIAPIFALNIACFNPALRIMSVNTGCVDALHRLKTGDFKIPLSFE